MPQAKNKTVSKTLRDKLVLQAMEEITFARDNKKFRVLQWHINEALLDGKKKTLVDLRANVGVAQTKAQGFEESLLSKIDEAPNIRYGKATEADLQKEISMNGLFKQEMGHTKQNLSFKDLMGKKDAICYGRAIYEYHASSKGGYKSHLTYLSPYDFLIDNAFGVAMDLEIAEYMGRTGIWKSASDLRKGVKDGIYISSVVSDLLGNGGDDATSEEEKEKEQSRIYIQGEGSKIRKTGKWNFWEWYTTYEEVRYYLLFNEDSKQAIRACELTEIFKSGLYPFWTWATHPSAKEFWSRAPLDQVREIFMAQGVSINQALDNSEQVNRPHKGVVAGAVKNIASLKYRRDGVTVFKKGSDLQQAVRVFETPSIDTPAKVYEILEGIGNIESPVNSGTRGVSDEDKVGIYEGNQANTADRFGLLNKSYAQGYYRFARLFDEGRKEHLTAKYAVRIQGKDGIEWSEISRRDFRNMKDDFDITVEASEAETANDATRRRTELQFLQSIKGDVNVNQKARLEMEGETVGMDQSRLTRLLDVSDFGDAKLMSEAARDIEDLLRGYKIEPNLNANNAYKEKIVNFMVDQNENMDDKTFDAFTEYVEKLTPIVTKNMVRIAMARRAQIGQLMIDTERGLSPQMPSGDPVAAME